MAFWCDPHDAARSAVEATRETRMPGSCATRRSQTTRSVRLRPLSPAVVTPPSTESLEAMFQSGTTNKGAWSMRRHAVSTHLLTLALFPLLAPAEYAQS